MPSPPYANSQHLVAQFSSRNLAWSRQNLILLVDILGVGFSVTLITLVVIIHKRPTGKMTWVIGKTPPECDRWCPPVGRIPSASRRPSEALHVSTGQRRKTRPWLKQQLKWRIGGRKTWKWSSTPQQMWDPKKNTPNPNPTNLAPASQALRPWPPWPPFPNTSALRLRPSLASASSRRCFRALRRCRSLSRRGCMRCSMSSTKLRAESRLPGLTASVWIGFGRDNSWENHGF